MYAHYMHAQYIIMMTTPKKTQLSSIVIFGDCLDVMKY